MSSSGIQPLSEEAREAFAEFANANERLSCQVPATLPSGFVVTEFHVQCACCSGDIPMHSSWLKRDRQVFGESVVETWDTRAFCAGCRTLTSAYARYRSNGTYDTLVGHQWRTGSLGSHDKRSGFSLHRLFRRLVRWMFGLR